MTKVFFNPKEVNNALSSGYVTSLQGKYIVSNPIFFLLVFVSIELLRVNLFSLSI